MGVEGLEPSTLRLSGVYSKPLSYMPLCVSIKTPSFFKRLLVQRGNITALCTRSLKTPTTQEPETGL